MIFRRRSAAIIATVVAAIPLPTAAQAPAATADPYIEREAANEFIRIVLAATEDVWTEQLTAGRLVPLGQSPNLRYRPPMTVSYEGAVTSACGVLRSESGPIYCEHDKRIYFDPDFFRTMSIGYRAPGDFAYAFVIAHETAHHVQKSVGILDASAAAVRIRPEVANLESVRVELQADCLAGVWSKAVVERFKVDDSDLREAVNAVFAFGDDSLQRSADGYVAPETFTHGTSAQRMRWYRRGFDSGDPAQCNTFIVRTL